MQQTTPSLTVLAALAVVLIIAAGFHASTPSEETDDAPVQFSKKRLFLDANEGAAVADVDRDGVLDVIAGRNWFAGPDFVPRPLRSVADWNGYVESNGDHAYDVNGDGWTDVVAGAFVLGEVHWYENPGPEGLAKGHLWTRHLLADTGSEQNEMTFLRDLGGDGAPEWIANSWDPESPVVAWTFADSARGFALERHVIGTGRHGHGMGFGDVNGDGREDVLVGKGWYERPPGDALAQTWAFHPDWDVHASVPILVRDLNGDGRSDLVLGHGHDFGLYWWEQKAPGPGGATRWDKHLIDDGFSQPHALAWADLDGEGQDELVTGKRKWAHNGKDPGGDAPPALYYYKWNGEEKTFTRYPIDEGEVGTGLQIRPADLNGDGRPDLVVAGKTGTFVLINEGSDGQPEQEPER